MTSQSVAPHSRAGARPDIPAGCPDINRAWTDQAMNRLDEQMLKQLPDIRYHLMSG
jgi:hypothetical protein